MQQQITETLVSFKVAKLAKKKKGFDEVCRYLYEKKIVKMWFIQLIKIQG